MLPPHTSQLGVLGLEFQPRPYGMTYVADTNAHRLMQNIHILLPYRALTILPIQAPVPSVHNQPDYIRNSKGPK